MAFAPEVHGEPGDKLRVPKALGVEAESLYNVE